MRPRSNWKIILLLALPMFGAAMWYGFAHAYEDMWLFAIIMALASLGIAGRAVFVVYKWKEWREQSRGGKDV